MANDSRIKYIIPDVGSDLLKVIGSRFDENETNEEDWSFLKLLAEKNLIEMKYFVVWFPIVKNKVNDCCFISFNNNRFVIPMFKYNHIINTEYSLWDDEMLAFRTWIAENPDNEKIKESFKKRKDRVMRLEEFTL